MSVCIEKLPHSCGSRDGLQVFGHEDGSVDGFCFSCHTRVPHPYGEPKQVSQIDVKVKTPSEVKQEVEEIGGYPVVGWPERKLSEKVLRYYGARVGFSEEDGETPRVLYFPCTKDGAITGYKAELINSTSKKRRWSVGDVKNCDLIGWQQAITTGSRRLYITEGEKDMCSAKSVLEKFAKEEYKGQAAVVSLTKGASNARSDVARLLPEIKRMFKEVVLVFDMDEPGRKAVAEVCSILPTAMVVDLPCKDANECVIEGHEKALNKALSFNASVPKNSRLVFGEDLHEAAKKPAEWGNITLPFQGLNNLTRNVRIGETWYWGAGVKMG